MKRNRYGPWQATTALAVSLLAAAVAAAAPPGDDGNDDSFVQSLTLRITDSRPLLRDGARDALVAIGKPALPALKRLAKTGDAEAAAVAKQLIARIGGDADQIQSVADRRDGPPPGRGSGRAQALASAAPALTVGTVETVTPGTGATGVRRGGRDGHRRGFDGFRHGRGGWDGHRRGFDGLGRGGRDGHRRGLDGFRGFPGFLGHDGRRRGFDGFRGFDGRDGRDGRRPGFDGFRGFGRFPGFGTGRRPGPDDGEKDEKKEEGKKPAPNGQRPPGFPGPGRGFPGFGPRPGFGPGFGSGSRGAGPGSAGLENALKDLNLTDKQKTQMEKLFAEEREAVEKIHEDFLKAVKQILDADQLKKLEKDLPKPPAPGGPPGFPGFRDRSRSTGA